MYIMTPVLKTNRRIRNIVRYTFPKTAVNEPKENQENILSKDEQETSKAEESYPPKFNLKRQDQTFKTFFL